MGEVKPDERWEAHNSQGTDGWSVFVKDSVCGVIVDGGLTEEQALLIAAAPALEAELAEEQQNHRDTQLIAANAHTKREEAEQQLATVTAEREQEREHREAYGREIPKLEAVVEAVETIRNEETDCFCSGGFTDENGCPHVRHTEWCIAVVKALSFLPKNQPVEGGD